MRNRIRDVVLAHVIASYVAAVGSAAIMYALGSRDIGLVGFIIAAPIFNPLFMIHQAEDYSGGFLPVSALSPTLLLYAIPFIAAAIWLLRRERMRLRQQRRSCGLCAECGYDLRASGQTCPECGTERA